MASYTSAPDASLPLTQELQAAALWTYVQAKLPRFTSQAALKVVRGLAPKPGEDVKHLAKRLRTTMAEHGVAIKHAAALEAAARLAGHANWHSANREPTPPLLKLVPISGSGNMVDMFSAPVEPFARWQDLVARMCRWCDERLRTQPTKVFQVNFASNHVMVGTPVPRRGGADGEMVPEPLFMINPAETSATWLDGAPAAFEALRRHLEERGVAALDGVAVLQLCHKYSDRGLRRLPSPGDIELTSDVANSELVLMREDNELSPHHGFEIARGDEMTCWAQLELAIKDHAEDSEITLDGEAWRIGKGRYVWEMNTIHPKDYVPGLIHRRLSEQDAERLLRRYKLVKRIFSGRVRHHEVNKRVAYLGGPEETYRVDLHRLLLAIQNGGHTWESLCKALNVEQEMTPHLPLGFVMSVAEHLALKDPNQFFARPNLSEMSRADDDSVLRTLLPRIDTVRYRLGAVSDEAKKVVKDAVTELMDSHRVRKMSAAGMFASSESELPQLVYAHDGEDLRLALEAHGLVLYASVLPHLFPLEGLGDKLPLENIAPYAFGHSLYLHIESAAATQH